MTEKVYEAIPVKYKGIKFRSKMEGKIARLLDNLGLEWKYEPITENGFTPDFKLKGKTEKEDEDLWIEVKYYLYGEGITSDADKIERFSKSHRIIIGGKLPERQYTNDWDSFVNRMTEISSEYCTGYNPYGFAPWNLLSTEGNTDLTVIVIMKDGTKRLVHYSRLMDEDINREKTLQAYYDATTYVFEAITEKQQEMIEQLQEENALLKRNTFKPKSEKGERKTARKQLVMKPSVKNGIEELAWKYHLSFNDFIHQLCERVLDGEITID